VPLVDKRSKQPNNILGDVVNRDEHDLYSISVKAGIWCTKYTRNQSVLSPQQFLKDFDMNTECTFSLHQAIKSTATVGQGFSIVTVAKA
jgi:hypothetical protein